MSDENQNPTYRKTDTGPFKELLFPGHATADDFDREAGTIGACVESADFNELYRGGLDAFSEAFAPEVEKLSGISRLVNEEATAKAKARSKNPDKVEPTYETYPKYFNRVKANISEDLWKEIDAQAHEVSKTFKIDVSPSARAAKASASSMAKAESILALSDDEIEAKVAKLAAVLPNYDLARDADGKPVKVALARMIDEWVKESL